MSFFKLQNNIDKIITKIYYHYGFNKDILFKHILKLNVLKYELIYESFIKI